MPALHLPPARFHWLLAFGLATRLLVLGGGSLLALLPLDGPSSGVRPGDALLPEPPAHWVEVWYRYDGLNYLRIALHGYPPGEPGLRAFLPALPVAMRAGTVLGLDVYVAGLLATNAAFGLGLALFGRAAAEASQDDATAWRACALLAAAPTAFFYSAPYQESLGFLCVSGALYAWLRRKPVVAAVSIAVGSAARQTAVMFAGAVLVEWLADLRAGRRARHSAWVVIVLGPVGFALFWWYVGSLGGDTAAMLEIQSHWGRRTPGVGNVLAVIVEGFSRPSYDHVTLLIFVALGAYAWYTKGPFWGALVLLPLVLLAATGTAMSMKRHALACFPVCYPLAAGLRNRCAFTGVLVLESALQLVFLWRYVHGEWVG